MSPVFTAQTLRPAARRLLTPAPKAASRPEAEAALRDIAFVLHLTQRVKAEILNERAGGPA